MEMQRNSTGYISASGGDDLLTYELLKEVPKKCHETILKFFNIIWQRGRHTATRHEEAIIALVLMSNKSAFETGFYRPMALTLLPCKLMEQLVISTTMVDGRQRYVHQVPVQIQKKTKLSGPHHVPC